jgi:hypothetical protein
MPYCVNGPNYRGAATSNISLSRFCNALRLARKGSPAPTAKGSEFGRRLRGKGNITG